MSDEVTDAALKHFGEFQYFRRTRVLHRHCLLLQRDALYQLNIDEGGPPPYYNDQDWFQDHFMRTYSDCILTTFGRLRRAPALFDVRGVVDKNGLDQKQFFHPSGVKPVAIITKSLPANLHAYSNVPMLQDPRFRKLIVSREKLITRYLDY